jgi:hypothetical protein
MTNREKPVSLGKSIFTILMFIFSVSMALYFAHSRYLGLVIQPAELAKEDAIYLAYGCTIDPDGQEYTCPNGLPPGAS